MPKKKDQFMDRASRNFEFEPQNKRGRTVRNEDPYVQDGMPEPSVCKICHAIYRNKRWYLKDREWAEVHAGETAHEIVCPACLKTDQLYPEGIVTLRGGYLWRHEEEILNILRSTENTAMAKNPLERIMSIKPEGDALIIETTEEKLAEHIGRALHKSHQGMLDITWSDNHSLCRVTWERGD